jgi:dephospho-CoA kinase
MGCHWLPMGPAAPNLRNPHLGTLHAGRPVLLVGLTGNIASGKSVVTRLLTRHGATIVDADVLARKVVEPGTPGHAEIVARWGRGVLLPDESVNREALRHIVFGDPAEREALNAIVHPRVQTLRDELLEEARLRGDRIVVCDIPLLFERALEAEFDCVILVDSPMAMRLDRLMRLRGLDEGEARRMIASQLPAETKRARARYVIENDGAIAELERRVAQIWRLLEIEAAR